MSLISENFEFFCTVFVLVKIARFIFSEIYAWFLAPSLNGEVDFKKMGKWAVVTGSTDGVGQAYAEALAKRGMNIVLISRNEEKLDAVATSIRKKYLVETKTIVADFTESSQIYATIEKALRDMEIGVLVNNVGLSYPHPDYFLELNDGERIYGNIVQCNVVSVLSMCRIVMPDMVRRKKGCVINISSATALIPSPLLSVYGATKMFVAKFSEDLAAEYKSQGIIVQCILPGFVATNMSKIRTPTLMAPSPKDFVESALKTVGCQSQTVGYWPHWFLPAVLNILKSISPTLATSTVMKNQEAIRVRALRAAAKLKNNS